MCPTRLKRRECFVAKPGLVDAVAQAEHFIDRGHRQQRLPQTVNIAMNVRYDPEFHRRLAPSTRSGPMRFTEKPAPAAPATRNRTS
jgi:hypothetical protein